MSAEALLHHLEHVRRSGPGRYMARCPSHNDKRASLSIRELEDGRTLVHCFAGCETDEILGILGLQFDALYPERPADPSPRKSIAKPWRASDVIRALDFELTIALVLLSDVSNGKIFDHEDKVRAAVARQRLMHFTQELARAY